jgi:hypothetical protein
MAIAEQMSRMQFERTIALSWSGEQGLLGSTALPIGQDNDRTSSRFLTPT